MKNYIKYMRRQGKHIQRMHAFIFAGTITFSIAAVVLYYDYGFWHDRYSRNEGSLTVTSTTTMHETPSEALSRFFGEAKNQFTTIKKPSVSIFEGKETYSKSSTTERETP